MSCNFTIDTKLQKNMTNLDSDILALFATNQKYSGTPFTEPKQADLDVDQSEFDLEEDDA